MKSNLTKASLALLSAVFILGCQDLGLSPVEPGGLGPQFAKGGNKGKPGGDGDVTPMQVTFTVGSVGASAHTFTTSAPVSLGKKNLAAGEFTIDPLMPIGSGRTMISAAFQVKLDKKSGEIVSVKVWVTEAAVFHHADVGWKTDYIPVDPPVLPSAAGFTLHVDANGVELTEVHTRRDPPIGTISIGDLVYTPQ